MNLNEFIEYFKRYKSVSSLPRHPMRHEWHRNSMRISDHYHGVKNGLFLENFPNEDDTVKAYRCRLWQPVTKSVLLPAVDDLQRVLSRSKYSVNFENERAGELANSKDIPQCVIKRIATRITEPDSVKVLWPNERKVSSETPTTIVDFDCIDVSYKRVLNRNDDFIAYFADGVDCTAYNRVFKEPKKRDSSNWYSDFLAVNHYDNTLPDGTKTRTLLHVITNEVFIKVDRTEQGKYIIYPVYNHDYDGIPYVINGGREKLVMCSRTHKSYIVHESDFSGSLAPLNDMELYHNQSKSVDLTSAFPIRFVQGQTCNTCHGTGSMPINESHEDYLNYPDKLISCSPCSGTGQVMPLSPLHGYFYRTGAEGATEEERKASALRKPIEYGVTDVDMCNYVSEKYTKARKEAIETLNIYRQTNHAQSAASKDQDKEGAQTQAERIGNDVFTKVQMLLKMYQALVTRDNESEVTVTRSISLRLDDESTLYDAYKAAMDCPVGMRQKAYISLVQRSFSTDAITIKRETIATNYATLYHATQEEIRDLKANGIPGIKRECVKAAYVTQLLSEIENFADLDESEIIKILDSRIDEIMQSEVEEKADLIQP